MQATVDGLRDYLRADPETYQSDLALLCLEGAKAYLLGAGVPEEDSMLYCLGAYMLAGHWYLNRGVTAIGTVQGAIQLGVQAIIHQLGGN